MPDKYSFSRYTNNLHHPWFQDVSYDFNRLSLWKMIGCIFCVLLMNVDMDGLPMPDREDGSQRLNSSGQNRNNGMMNSNASTAIVSLESTDIATSNNASYKQCNKVPIIDYFGSSKGNLFHTQLMIGVMVGYLMNCRLPILLSFFNIILRSGASFKPKSFPMFINNVRQEPTNPCGSSYKLLNARMTYTHLDFYDSSSSSDEDEDDDDDEEDYSDEDTDTQHLQKEVYSCIAYDVCRDDVVDYEH